MAGNRISSGYKGREEATGCYRIVESGLLVRSHQPRIARDIGGEDRRKTARFSHGYRLARPSIPVGDAAVDEHAPVGHPVSPAILKRS